MNATSRLDFPDWKQQQFFPRCHRYHPQTPCGVWVLAAMCRHGLAVVLLPPLPPPPPLLPPLLLLLS
jgi:hypothetical protein